MLLKKPKMRFDHTPENERLSNMFPDIFVIFVFSQVKIQCPQVTLQTGEQIVLILIPKGTA